jgi:hypothetical protein
MGSCCIGKVCSMAFSFIFIELWALYLQTLAYKLYLLKEVYDQCRISLFGISFTCFFLFFFFIWGEGGALLIELIFSSHPHQYCLVSWASINHFVSPLPSNMVTTFSLTFYVFTSALRFFNKSFLLKKKKTFQLTP